VTYEFVRGGSNGRTSAHGFKTTPLYVRHYILLQYHRLQWRFSVVDTFDIYVEQTIGVINTVCRVHVGGLETDIGNRF